MNTQSRTGRWAKLCFAAVSGLCLLVLLSWASGRWQLGTMGNQTVPMEPGSAISLLGLAAAAWLVLMDLVMPVMNGLAATRCIKAWPGAPRVVIVTIHDNAEYRRSAQEASADGFICKPQFASEVTALVDAFFNAPGPLVQAGRTQ